MVIEDFLVNPWSALEGRLDPLDAGRVRFESATLALADLQAYVAALPRLRGSVVAADGDALLVTVRQAGPDVSARVRLQSAADRPFALAADHVRVGLRARARPAGELGHPQLRSVRADRGAACRFRSSSVASA